MQATLPPESITLSLVRGTESFKTTFLKVACAAGLGACVLVLPMAFALNLPGPLIFSGFTALFGSTVGYYLARQQMLRPATLTFLGSILVGSFSAGWFSPDGQNLNAAMMGISTIFLTTVATLVVSVRLGAFFATMGSCAVLALGFRSWLSGVNDTNDLISNSLIAAILVVMETVCLALFTQQSNNNMQALQTYARDIERAMESARRIAAGDLSQQVDGDSEVAQVIRSMLEGLKSIVAKLQRGVGSLSAATAQIAAMASQQEEGAVEQASAVAEVRQTLEFLLEGSRRIADATQEVFLSIERTQSTNELISEQIQNLTTHSNRITEILEIIKDIANKSELLALNASLEGAKAGEAGAGFSLVANQMQRLAENVMASVKDVKALTADIRQATRSAALSTEQGTKMATSATEAARQINLVAQEQRTSTEQVTRAMDDITDVADRVSQGSSQTQAATTALTDLTAELNEIVESFKV